MVATPVPAPRPGQLQAFRPPIQYSLPLPAPGSIPPPPSFGGPPTEDLAHFAIDQATAPYQAESREKTAELPVAPLSAPDGAGSGCSGEDHPAGLGDGRGAVASLAGATGGPGPAGGGGRRRRAALARRAAAGRAGRPGHGGATAGRGAGAARGRPGAGLAGPARARSGSGPGRRACPAPGAEPAATPAAPRPAADPAAQAAQAQRLVASAEKRYERGDFAGAVAEFRRSLAAKATPPGFVGLARALYDSNQTAEALKVLESAQRLDPRYAPTFLLLGEIQQGEGRVAPARAAYQRFLQLQPTGEQARAVREILAKQLR